MTTHRSRYGWMALGGLLCLFGVVFACKVRDGNRAMAQADANAPPPAAKEPAGPPDSKDGPAPAEPAAAMNETAEPPPLPALPSAAPLPEAGPGEAKLELPPGPMPTTPGGRASSTPCWPAPSSPSCANNATCSP